MIKSPAKGSIRGGAGVLMASGAEMDPPRSPEAGTGTVSAEASSRRPMILTRLLLWLVFGVLIGALPLLADGIKDSFGLDGFSFDSLLSQGELFIISSVIAAGAIGELFVAKLPDRERNYRIAGGGFCLLFCLGNAIAYASSTVSVACSIAEQRTIAATSSVMAQRAALAQRAACMGSPPFIHPTTVVHLSLLFFIPTVVLSAACIGMAAGR
jgi:hypothetical protein